MEAVMNVPRSELMLYLDFNGILRKTRETMSERARNGRDLLGKGVDVPLVDANIHCQMTAVQNTSEQFEKRRLIREESSDFRQIHDYRKN